MNTGSNRHTIGTRLAALRAPAGFDYMRLALSIAVLCVHSVAVSYGRDVEDRWIWSSPLEGPVRLILPMFFALSGFLVSGSVGRAGSTSGFVLLRMLRLIPALAVEVTFSALIVGAIFTTLPLADYVQSRQFLTYFANVIGWIHFLLPGVFQSNPMNIAVNISLWTIPYELECYLILVAAMVTRLVRVRAAMAVLTVIGCIAGYVHSLAAYNPAFDTGSVEPRVMVLSFLAGCCVYFYRDRLRLSPVIFMACLASAIALLYSRETAYLCPPFVGYATVWLGMQNPRKLKIVTSGDYSYGIYLYAFPFQQAIASFPGLRHWWLNILVALPLTALFAAFSWHCVEKHVLRFKGRVAGVDAPLPRFENWMLGHLGRGWAAVSRRHVATPAP